jgi:O-antigen ligase/tetratricopeptide (TPR) repeat protein
VKKKKQTLISLFFFGVAALHLTPLLFSAHFYNSFGGVKMFVFILFVELLFPLYLYLQLSYPELRPNWKNPVLLVAALLIFLLSLSTLFGEDLTQSLFGSLMRSSSLYLLLHFFLYFLYLQLIFSEGKNYLFTLFYLLIFSGTLSTTIGLLEHTGIITTFYQDTERASGLIGNPIHFAAFLIIPLFLSLFIAQKQKNKWRQVVLYANALFLFIGIWISDGSGALLGVFCGVVLTGFLIFLVGATKKRIIATLGILLLLIVGSSIYGVSLLKLSEHESTHDALYEISYSAANRYDQWIVALRGFPERPWIGTGPENYYIVAQKYFIPEQYETSFAWPDKPHNYPIELLVTTGLLGCLAYLSLIIFIFVAFWRSYKNKKLSKTEASLLSGGLGAYFIQNLFLFETFSASMTFWLLVSFAAFLITTKSSSSINRKISKFNITLFTLAAILTSFFLLIKITVPIYHIQTQTELATTAIHQGNTENAIELVSALDNITPILDHRSTLIAHYDLTIRALTDERFVEEEIIEELFQRSFASTKTYLDNHPKHVHGYLLYSQIQAAYSDWKQEPVPQEAYEHIEDALDLSPQRTEILAAKAQLHLADDDIELALKTINEAYEISKNRQPGVLWVYALLNYSETDDAATYAPLAYQAIEFDISINDPNNIIWIIQYYLSINDLATILDILERITKMYPNSSQFLPNLAATYAELEMYDSARNTLEQMRMLSPEESEKIDSFLATLPE